MGSQNQKSVANINFIWIHKGSLHSNIIFTRHTNAAFFFSFSVEKQRVRLSFFPSYPIFSSSLTQARLHSEGALWT